VTNREVAARVFKDTHPVQWTAVQDHLASPEVGVNGQTVLVEIHPGLFPRVVVLPGGEFRCFNPWGWPRLLLRWSAAEQRFKRETRRRLMALGLRPTEGNSRDGTQE
jgi:hypothetical protein